MKNKNIAEDYVKSLKPPNNNFPGRWDESSSEWVILQIQEVKLKVILSSLILFSFEF